MQIDRNLGEPSLRAFIPAGITIGSGASIGPNAVVVSNVPEGVTYVGKPAKVRVVSEGGDQQA